ncbi:CNH domain-containing protein [Entamoeba marina]
MDDLGDPVTVTQINIEKYEKSAFAPSNTICGSSSLTSNTILLSTLNGMIIYNIMTRSIDHYFSEALPHFCIHIIDEHGLLIALRSNRICFYIIQPTAQSLQQFLIPITRLGSQDIDVEYISVTHLKKSVIIATVDKSTKKCISIEQYTVDGSLMQKKEMFQSKDIIQHIQFINMCLCIVTKKEVLILPCLRKGKPVIKKMDIESDIKFHRISAGQIILEVNSCIYLITDSSITLIETSAPVAGVLQLPPLLLLFHELNPHRYFMSYILNNNKPSPLYRRTEFTDISFSVSKLLLCLPCNRLCIFSLRNDWYRQLLINGRIQEGLQLYDKQWDFAGSLLRVFELLSEVYQTYRIEKNIHTEPLHKILSLLQRTTTPEITHSLITTYILQDFCPSIYPFFQELYPLSTSEITAQLFMSIPQQLFPRLNETLRMFFELLFLNTQTPISATAHLLLTFHLFDYDITPTITTFITTHPHIDSSIIEKALLNHGKALLGFLTLREDVTRIMKVTNVTGRERLNALVGIAKRRQWQGDVTDPISTALQEIAIQSFRNTLYLSTEQSFKQLKELMIDLFGGEHSIVEPKIAMALIDTWEVSRNQLLNAEASKRLKIAYLHGLLNTHSKGSAPKWLVNWVLVEYVHYTHAMAEIGAKVPLCLLKKCVRIIQIYPDVARELEKITQHLSWECFVISAPIALTDGENTMVKHFVAVLRKYYVNHLDVVMGDSGILKRVEDDLLAFITVLNDRFGNTTSVSRSTLIHQLIFYQQHLSKSYTPFLEPSITTPELQLFLYILKSQSPQLLIFTIQQLLDSYRYIPLQVLQSLFHLLPPQQLPLHFFKSILQHPCSSDKVYFKLLLADIILQLRHLSQLSLQVNTKSNAEIVQNASVIKDNLVNFLLEYTSLPGEDSLHATTQLVDILTTEPKRASNIYKAPHLPWRVKARVVFFTSKYKALYIYLQNFKEEYSTTQKYFEPFSKDLLTYAGVEGTHNIIELRKNFKPFCEARTLVLTEALEYCLAQAPDGVTSPLLGVLLKSLHSMGTPPKFLLGILQAVYRYVPPVVTSDHEKWMGMNSNNKCGFRLVDFVLDVFNLNDAIPLLLNIARAGANDVFSLHFKAVALKANSDVLRKRFVIQQKDAVCTVCHEVIGTEKFVVLDGEFCHLKCK